MASCGWGAVTSFLKYVQYNKNNYNHKKSLKSSNVNASLKLLPRDNFLPCSVALDTCLSQGASLASLISLGIGCWILGGSMTSSVVERKLPTRVDRCINFTYVNDTSEPIYPEDLLVPIDFLFCVEAWCIILFSSKAPFCLPFSLFVSCPSQLIFPLLSLCHRRCTFASFPLHSVQRQGIPT